ncbi:MAG: N-acetylmuramoyl-L-alanine amidase [Candidatus Aminicenantales bacterium]
MLSRKKRTRDFIWPIALFFFLVFFSFPQDQNILRISVKDFQNFSRITIESSFPLSPKLEKRSSFLMVKIRPNAPFRIKKGSIRSRAVEAVGGGRAKEYYLLNFRMKSRNFGFDYFSLINPPQLVIDVTLTEMERRRQPSEESAKEAVSRRAESGQEPLSRPSPKKTIVIDPGHGGLETGAKGKFGTEEKHITLAIGLKLKAIIERHLAARVVLTRDKDIDVSLDSRAAMANNNRADVFISIHTNSSYRKDARGSETFFLSRNATDQEARRLAYLENNSADLESGIVDDNKDEIQMILWDMAQAAYLKQSSQLAEFIQRELNVLLGTENRGIKQAPFKVLTGVASPAVLVEVAFISNPEEERRLETEEFQEGVAQAIYRGLVNFLRVSSRE